MAGWRARIASKTLLVSVSAIIVVGCDGTSRESLVPPISPSPVSVPGSVAAGTLLVQGFVRQSFQSCIGCLVEILDGPAAGTTASTVEGRFSFTIRNGGANVEIRVSKEGYRTVTTVASVGEGTSIARVTLSLESALPPLPLANNYTMTIEADSMACSQAPQEAQTRTYDVTLVRAYSDTSFSARPADRDVDKFIVFIGVSGNEFVMHAEDGNDESAGIVESLASGVVRVHIWSSVTAVTDPRFIQIPVAGEISYCRVGQPCTVCSSLTHRLTLTAN